MRFMIIRKADNNTEAGILPTQSELEAMGQFNQKMVQDGVFLDGMGLKPTRFGVRIDFHNGQPVISEGPFTETKELLAGFTLFEAESLTAAIERVKHWPVEDGNGNASLELRQVYELEDFLDGEGLAVHKAMAARLSKQPATLCPYLNFMGNCAEAMHYYAEVLGGEIQMMMTYGESPMAGDVGEDSADKIIHAGLLVGKQMIMGADVTPACSQQTGCTTVQISFADTQAARRAFDALADQGTVVMPFQETFFSKGFGMLKDRFGTSWMVNCDTPTD